MAYSNKIWEAMSLIDRVRSRYFASVNEDGRTDEKFQEWINSSTPYQLLELISDMLED